MGLLKFYNAVDVRSLVKAQTGYLAGDTTTKPGAAFTAGDVETVEFTALARNPQGGIASPWSTIPVAQYTFQMGLFLPDRTQLSYQNFFTPDPINNKYTGTFSLNTAAIQALFGAGPGYADRVCTLELQMTDLNGYVTRSYRNDAVLLKNGLISAGALVAAAGETAATQSWVRELFMPRNWPIGMHFIARDANGNAYDGYMDVDGLHLNPMQNPPPGPDPNI